MYSDPEKTVNGFASLIRSHVKADPRSLFTADQFESNIAKSPNGLQITNPGSQNPWGGIWGGLWGGQGGLFSYGGEQVSVVDFMVKRNEVILSTLK